MLPVAASFLLTSGLPLSMVCAVVGLVAALYLIKSILAVKVGNERMRQIAGAIEEGAKAYLGRQVRSIVVIAVVIVVLSVILGEFVRVVLLASAGAVAGVPTLAKLAKATVVLIGVLIAFMLVLRPRGLIGEQVTVSRSD